MITLGCADGTVHGVSDVGWLRWEFTADDAVATPPAVVHDGSEDPTVTVFVGSEDNRVYAIDQSDGTEQWRFETDGRVLSGPAVVDGTVYVGSYDNYVYALDAADGTEQWRFETGDSVWASPSVRATSRSAWIRWNWGMIPNW